MAKKKKPGGVDISFSGFGASLKDVYEHRESKAKAKQGAPGSQRRAQYEKLRKRAEKVYAKGFEGRPFKGFGGHRPAEQLLDPKSKHHNPKAYRDKLRKIMSKLKTAAGERALQRKR